MTRGTGGTRLSSSNNDMDGCPVDCYINMFVCSDDVTVKWTRNGTMLFIAAHLRNITGAQCSAVAVGVAADPRVGWFKFR